MFAFLLLCWCISSFRQNFKTKILKITTNTKCFAWNFIEFYWKSCSNQFFNHRIVHPPLPIAQGRGWMQPSRSKRLMLIRIIDKVGVPWIEHHHCLLPNRIPWKFDGILPSSRLSNLSYLHAFIIHGYLIFSGDFRCKKHLCKHTYILFPFTYIIRSCAISF